MGEGLSNADRLREETKGHNPYLVPIFDWRDGKLESDEEMFLHTIPFMQFPGLLAGRPFTGERSVIPGVGLPGTLPSLTIGGRDGVTIRNTPTGPTATVPGTPFPAETYHSSCPRPLAEAVLPSGRTRHVRLPGDREQPPAGRPTGQ